MKRYLGGAVASSLCQAGAAEVNPSVSGYDAGHREIYDSGDPTMLLNREMLSCQVLPFINRVGAPGGDDPLFLIPFQLYQLLSNVSSMTFLQTLMKMY